jgi:hypothetical protein
MQKIANTQELQAQLRRLLAYTESPLPSRAKIAFELGVLAELTFPKYSKVFPNQKALDEYLRAHPSADKSKHRVEDADVQRIRKDLEPFQKLKKVQEKEDQRQDRKDKKKVVKDLTKHQKAHPPGSINWKYDPKDNKSE